MTTEKSSTIRPSKLYAATPFLIGAAGVAGAGALAYYEHWIIALLVAGFAALAASSTSSILGDADCPVCGETLRQVAPYHRRCHQCRHYVVPENGALREVPADFVAPGGRPYAFPLPSGPVSMPALCCACGAPAARTVVVARQLPVAQGALTTTLSTFRVDMPHCDRHDGGAAIDTYHDPVRDESFLAVKVSSHAFYRAFMTANGGF